jgi:hypothetical protein
LSIANELLGIPLALSRDDGAVHCPVAPNACSDVPFVAKDRADLERVIESCRS